MDSKPVLYGGDTVGSVKIKSGGMANFSKREKGKRGEL